MKHVWFFGGSKTEGGAEHYKLLGNKGAQLAEMAKIGLPVPPGFTITTEACRKYYSMKMKIPPDMEKEIKNGIAHLERLTSRKFGEKSGSSSNSIPLLVSVRSGAPVSMPGMMDTILNVGINKENLDSLIKIDERFGYDTWRRFIQMFSTTVLGLDKEYFSKALDRWKKVFFLVKNKNFSNYIEAYENADSIEGEEWKSVRDIDLPPEVISYVSESFLKIVEEKWGKFPQDPWQHLLLSIEAVFRSWNGERAVWYRKINKIPDDLGTAVSVVTMVFGNMGENSGTGVFFTRNPDTGEKEIYGDFLPKAQGEDVVAGIRTPLKIKELETRNRKLWDELKKISKILERHYLDMQDVEFTIERGKLWILQTRNGKRSPTAAVKIAVDLAQEKLITKAEAIRRIKPEDITKLLYTVISPDFNGQPFAKGVDASPGAVTGKVVFSPQKAYELSSEGEKVILVRIETSPEDIKGMAAAVGILTARGGKTSHAAVVARGMGKPAVVGVESLNIDYDSGVINVDSSYIREGDIITIDGSTGAVYKGDVPKVKQSFTKEAEKFLQWADEIKRLGVRANADTPEDAKIARDLGAEGIGLLRTEHMFFKGDRIFKMRKMIILAPKYKRKKDEQKAIEDWIIDKVSSNQKLIKKVSEHNKLLLDYTNTKEKIDLESLTFDYETYTELKNIKNKVITEIFRIAKEMFPHDNIVEQKQNAHEKLIYDLESLESDYRETLLEIKSLIREDFEKIFEVMEGLPVTVRLIDPPLHEFLPKEERQIVETSESTGISVSEIRDALKNLDEANPMLGHRGVRVGITYPEIYIMQTEAILEAAKNLIKNRKNIKPEIMIPNVIDPKELSIMRLMIERVWERIEKSYSVKIPLLIGTMIEFPRACIVADRIAQYADFFSFGTNDLTQTVFGFSRDDVGKFIYDYINQNILDGDPFSVLDADGVGEFLRVAVKKGRKTRQRLKIGVCGEHGGDPASIGLFHCYNLDYVSCSAYRVPVARLAAAQVQIEKPRKDKRK